MAKVFAITNQKGGVGKTTTTINTSASLAAKRRRVLVVDLDPQGNATMGSGIDKNELGQSMYDVLMGECTLEDAIYRSDTCQYDILPANADLTAAEVELMAQDNKETRLRDALAQVDDDYDFIVIDCSPSLNILTVNALVAAAGVIIPVQCEYFALEGLAALVNTIEEVSELLNPGLEIEGLVRTMFDPRNSLTRDVSEELIGHFGKKVYKTVIPRNVRLAEAPSFGVPVLGHDRNSTGAQAYLALAAEIMKKNRTNRNRTKKKAVTE